MLVLRVTRMLGCVPSRVSRACVAVNGLQVGFARYRVPLWGHVDRTTKKCGYLRQSPRDTSEPISGDLVHVDVKNSPRSPRRGEDHGGRAEELVWGRLVLRGQLSWSEADEVVQVRELRWRSRLRGQENDLLRKAVVCLLQANLRLGGFPK